MYLFSVYFRGVIQLFNAVRQQQKSVNKTLKKAGKSERKREKLIGSIDKRKFLDGLSKNHAAPEIKSEDEVRLFINNFPRDFSILYVLDSFSFSFTRCRIWKSKRKVLGVFSAITL